MATRTRSISGCCLLGGLLLLSLNLHAKTLNVRCGTGGGSDLTSITAALAMLNPNVPNTLKIFGVCQENVVISGFNRLTLIGRQGATVVDPSGGAAQTFLVVDSTDVYFQTLRVDGGLVGVQCDDFSVCRFSSMVIGNAGAEFKLPNPGHKSAIPRSATPKMG